MNREQTRRLRAPDFLWWIPLAVSLVYAVPVGGPRCFDLDEGYNLMRGALLARGYPLYESIWCDQPPLFTWILSVVVRACGHSLIAARLAAVAFSFLLAGSFYALVRSIVGRPQALIAAVLLCASTLYLRLSLSVMEAIPSFALALFGLALLGSDRAGLFRVGVSGIALALAAQIKLNTLFFLPFGLVLLLTRPAISRGWKGRLLRAAAWMIPFAFSFALIQRAFVAGGALEVFRFHWDSRQVAGFAPLEGSVMLPQMFRWDLDLLVVAVLGAWTGVRRGVRGVAFFMAWLVTAIAALWFHRPVWYHYYLFLSLPIVTLASLALAELLDLHTDRQASARSRTHPGFAAAVTTIALVLILSKLRTHRNHLQSEAFALEQPLLERLESHRPTTAWTVAVNRQIYPFLAGMLVPPELAVTSWKRDALGELPMATVVRVFDTYRPEVVILERDLPVNPQLREWVEAAYRVEYDSEHSALYVGRELAAP